MTNHNRTRRDVVKLAVAASIIPSHLLASDEKMILRTIHSSGEKLPVIGLGTYNVFDVESSEDNIASRQAVVEALVDGGGSLVDSSPMYNRSENIVGDIIAASDNRDRLFLATKVWTDGKIAGEQQMAESARLMNTDVIDLMQVHNLRDLATHMDTIRDWQARKKIRYSGITHYTSSSLPSLEKAMKAERPEFIQINYSLGEREAGNRVLPLAADMGIAVIVNRPFVAGRLFSAVGDSALPEWATPFAASWGQFMLKFIISNPAVTCVIPATSKVHHMVDNVAAGYGRLPDAAERERMIQFVATL